VNRKAFTVVELMVVIVIIMIMAGLLLVGIHAARRSGERARMASDLHTISVALDAYKADFGDYPRVRMDGATVALPGKFPISMTFIPPPPLPDLFNPAYISGSELLCWALIGPYPQNPTGAWFAPGDGTDGPGFRLNRDPGPDGIMGNADDVCRGQVYPSYLNVERFRFGQNAAVPRYSAILDNQGNPILYFPLTPTLPGQGWTSICDRWNPAAAPGALNYHPAYDLRDNDAPFWRQADIFPPNPAAPLARMRVMLGDLNNNGVIDAGETPPPTLPYLLWSAGPDGLYGPADPTNPSNVTNCDDVTNLKN